MMAEDRLQYLESCRSQEYTVQLHGLPATCSPYEVQAHMQAALKAWVEKTLQKARSTPLALHFTHLTPPLHTAPFSAPASHFAPRLYLSYPRAHLNEDKANIYSHNQLAPLLPIYSILRLTPTPPPPTPPPLPLVLQSTHNPSS